MKFVEISSAAGAILALQASVAYAKHSHALFDTVERRHYHHTRESYASKVEAGPALDLRSFVEVERRGGQCKFPSDAGLVAVTPDAKNGGWALSPDQPCKPGNYCPYACPSGQMMAQWNPEATSYSYPLSMDGGLYCDKDGNIHKPFPEKSYCMDGTGNIGVKDKTGKGMAWCQTVLPGNEAMLIPTSIQDWAQITVPGPDYWCGTAAHFYINPPGRGYEEVCVWGTNENPWGNWSPYVAGANTDQHGNTFVKLGINPIWLEPGTPFRDEVPKWGVEIVCDGAGCNGLPCAVDPGRSSVNEMVGGSSKGAGGAAFCVVTVPQGVKANFVVFEGELKNHGGDKGSGSSSAPQSSQPPPPPPSSSSPSPAPSSAPPSPPSSASSSSSDTPTSSSTPSSSPASSSSDPSSTSSASSSYSASISTTAEVSSASSTPIYPTHSYSAHVLVQNDTATATAPSASVLVQTATASGTNGAFGPPAATSPIVGARPDNAGRGRRVTLAGLALGLLMAVFAVAV